MDTASYQHSPLFCSSCYTKDVKLTLMICCCCRDQTQSYIRAFATDAMLNCFFVQAEGNLALQQTGRNCRGCLLYCLQPGVEWWKEYHCNTGLASQSQVVQGCCLALMVLHTVWYQACSELLYSVYVAKPSHNMSHVGVRPRLSISTCSKTAMLFWSWYAHGASLHAALALTHASSSCLSYNLYFWQSLGSPV